LDAFFTSSTGNTLVRFPRQCGSVARSVAENVARRHNIGLDDILSPSRVRKTVAARFAVIRALWETGRYSQSDIARFLNRHPSTINLALHGKKARPWIERKKAA